METTYSDDTDNQTFPPPVSPCSGEDVNYLGAQLSILYYFMFVFSVFGNGLVLFIIYRFEKQNTVINILLVNLVASSLIFMSSLPFLGVYMQLSDWIFGSVMCKIVFIVYYMGLYSSVFFLTLLTFDRYLAIVHSLPAVHMRNQTYAVISCSVVWLISGLACIRPMLLHNTYRILGREYCGEYVNLIDIDEKMLKKSGFYIQLFVFLILPLAAIIFCYIRIAITIMPSRSATKFKTVRLIFIIVVLFFICWAPFNVVELLHDDDTDDCKVKQKLGYALQVTRNMAYLYFCISPIFYTFMGRKFQQYFRLLLVNRFPLLKNLISINEDSRRATSLTGSKLSNRSLSVYFSKSSKRHL